MPDSRTGAERVSCAGAPRGRWATWLLAFAILLTTRGAPAATLTRGPYLQLLTTHSVTVVWYTSGPARCGLALTAPDGTTTVLAGNTAAVCVVPVDGLSP